MNGGNRVDSPMSKSELDCDGAAQAKKAIECWVSFSLCGRQTVTNVSTRPFVGYLHLEEPLMRPTSVACDWFMLTNLNGSTTFHAGCSHLHPFSNTNHKSVDSFDTFVLILDCSIQKRHFFSFSFFFFWVSHSPCYSDWFSQFRDEPERLNQSSAS